MLTETELAWLDARRVEPFSFCNHCWSNFAPHCEDTPQCPLTISSLELYDVIEFEQRVEAKLSVYASMARDVEICIECPCMIHGICFEGIEMHCKDIFLKTARLQVEEEMDG